MSIMGAIPKGGALPGLHLLLVDDDAELCSLLAPVLGALGLQVHVANNVSQALDRVGRVDFLIAVLDVQLPDGSGFSIASHLRRYSPGTRVIMLSRLSDASWQVAGYDIGADVYLPKPVHPDLLSAAVRNLAARAGQEHADATPPAVAWHLDGGGWRLRAPNGEAVNLNRAERALLRRLAASAHDIVSREDLIEALAQDEESADPQRLDMLFHRLRRKAVAHGLPSLPLQAVRGQGYVLMASVTGSDPEPANIPASPDDEATET